MVNSDAPAMPETSTPVTTAWLRTSTSGAVAQRLNTRAVDGLSRKCCGRSTASARPNSVSTTAAPTGQSGAAATRWASARVCRTRPVGISTCAIVQPSWRVRVTRMTSTRHPSRGGCRRAWHPRPRPPRGRHRGGTTGARRVRSLIAMTGATIEARGLRKRYGRTVAVDGLSFVVTPGEVTGFVGPNGAGKSTTMRIILGLDAPDDGEALVGGRPYRTLRAPLRHVGALRDASALHPGRRARDHLLWMAHSNGISRRRVDEALELVGLASVARRRAGGFSLGMRQRLGIAGALLGDPPILMFDEPVNGLDPEGIRWIRGLLRGLAGEGRAVLVSSHLMGELEGTADHLIVIGHGRLVIDTSVSDLIETASGGRVTVRTSRRAEAMTVLANAGATVAANDRESLTVSGLAAERIASLLSAEGLPFSELSRHRASLEEAYMELTRDTTDFRAPAGGAR